MKIGRLSENIYERSVLKELRNQGKEIISGAGRGNDCAILSSGPEDAAVSMVVAAQTADQVGMLAVHRAANEIAASGAWPAAVKGMLLLTEGASEDELKSIARQIGKTCEELGIQIAGLEVLTLPAALIPDTGHFILTMTGFGKINHNCLPVDRKAERGFAKPKQDVVMTKWAGLEGTYLIASEKEKELGERFSAEYIEEAKGFDRYLSILPEAATAVMSGVGAMHNVSEGGIFGALWEMAKRSGVGLEIELKKIPIRQETVEICNYFDINPYALLSSGCLLLTADNGYDLVGNLHKKGISAAVIGRTTDSNDRLVINEEEKRFLTPAQTDEYFKLIGK